MNRRDLLRGAAASAAVVALPFTPALSAVVEPAASPILPAWIVGTDGEYNWQFIRAASRSEALTAWIADMYGEDSCYTNAGAPPEDCDCDFCYHRHCLEANRMEHWDALLHEPIPADWLESGIGHICEACGYETSQDGGAKIISGAPFTRKTVLCEDCADDWNRHHHDPDDDSAEADTKVVEVTQGDHASAATEPSPGSTAAVTVPDRAAAEATRTASAPDAPAATPSSGGVARLETQAAQCATNPQCFATAIPAGPARLQPTKSPT